MILVVLAVKKKTPSEFKSSLPRSASTGQGKLLACFLYVFLRNYLLGFSFFLSKQKKFTHLFGFLCGCSFGVSDTVL